MSNTDYPERNQSVRLLKETYGGTGLISTEKRITLFRKSVQSILYVLDVDELVELFRTTKKILSKSSVYY